MKKIQRPRVEDIDTGEQFKIVDIGSFEVNHALNEPSVIDFKIFDTERNKFAFQMLKEYNFIIYKNEYYLTYLHEEDSSNTKDGVAIHVSSLLKKKRVHDEHTGSYSLNDGLKIALDGSGFTFINCSTKSMKLQFENFGKDDRLSMLQHILKRFNVECYFSKYTVYIFDKVGTETDYQFRFGYNVKALNKKVDVTDCNFSVRILGHKPTDEEGGGDQFIYYYESPLKYHMPKDIQDWEAPEIEDDKIKHVETARERGIEAVQDTPIISITVAHEELPNEKERVPGIGDRALVRHYKMKLDFDLRIIKIREHPYSNKSNEYEFSNKREDVIDRNANKNEEKFDLDLLMKQIKEINGKIVNFVTAATLDGKFDDAEKAQYEQLLNTKNELETKAKDLANGALSSANSYTDVAKQNAIDIAKAEAQQKAKEAQVASEAYTKAQAELVQKEAEAHADGVVTASEKAILDQAEQKVVAAKKYAEQKARESQVAAEKSAALDATNKADKAKADAIAAAKAEADRLAKEAKAAAQEYTKAQTELLEKQAKAYADNVITDSEKIVLAEAEKKVADAKKYAEQKAKEAEAAANKRIDGLSPGERNYLRNSNLADNFTKNDVGWDNNLNGNLLAKYWSTGFNPGVNDPQKGYHAHLDTETFGYPVFAFINKNSSIGQPARWLGMANQTVQDFNTQELAGKEITISFDAWADTTGFVFQVGLHHYITENTTQSFHSGLKGVTVAVTKQWIRYSVTFKVHDKYDYSKLPTVYIYGHYGKEGSGYVKGGKLSIGNMTNGWSQAIEDVQAGIDAAKSLADQKLKEAQAAAQKYTEQKAAYEREQAKAYADNKLTTSEEKTLADAKAKLDEAKRHAETKATEAKNAAIAAAQADAKAKADVAKQAAIAAANAENKLAEERTKAYADKVITAEEAARLKGLENTLAAAKQDAQSKASAAQKAATDAAALDASNKASQATQNAKSDVQNGKVPVPTGSLNGPINPDKNKIKNAYINLDENGCLLDQGNFRLRDPETGNEEIVRTDNNMIYDHSFEQLQFDSRQNLRGKIYHYTGPRHETDTKYGARPGVWYCEGDQNVHWVGYTPGSDGISYAAYGDMFVEVNMKAQWSQYTYLNFDNSLKKRYTMSVALSKGDVDWDGAAKIRLRVLAYGKSFNYLSHVGQRDVDIPVTMVKKWKRYSVTTNTDLPEGTVFLRCILESVRAWAWADGVQLVPYEKPIVYNPENSLYALRNRGLETNIIKTNCIKFTGGNPYMIDNGVMWWGTGEQGWGYYGRGANQWWKFANG